VSDKDAKSPAKAISRWADTVNWILLNATSMHIPAHLRTTLEEECLRIRAAVAHEQPPASPSAADKTRRMQANPGRLRCRGAHGIEHDETLMSKCPPACKPVDPPASPSAVDKQSRRMKAHTGEPLGTYHSQEHDEKQSCGDWPPCQPVDPLAPLSLPTDAAGVAASWRNAVDRGKERDVRRRMKANRQMRPDTYHGQEHDEGNDCTANPACEPVDPPTLPSPPADAAGKERDVTKSATLATWHVSLNCECPKCAKYVDLLEYADFWDGRTLELAEHGTDTSRGVEVVCPNCGHEFEVDCEY